MQNISHYLSELSKYYADPTSTEMSYRTALQNYLESIFPAPEYVIQHDPKVASGNKPDYIIRRGEVPLLYIEVKDPRKATSDLDKIEKSEQAARYFGYTNLIISDYAEFRFYRNGESYTEPIRLAELNKTSQTLIPHPENGDSFASALHDFIQSQKEPIKSGKHLAKIMGGKAQRIRENVVAFVNGESNQKDELERMMRFIREHLIHEFEVADFADMYAQTLVYGLFAARYNDDTLESFSRQEARELVPATNPFLKSFFDHISGSSFPKRLEIMVDELCEVFSHADVKALMEDYFKQTNLFGEEHEAPDPVIHFYEDFLREYDPKKKMEMGVFYTPLPIVRFIVRGIDDILKREFGIQDGLADTEKITQTRMEEAPSTAKSQRVKITEEVHRVQLLDVAVGTGTFLNETLHHIHETKKHNQGHWGAYVNEHLLPRLHGFELMMASYTIAHLKLAMTMRQTGVREFKNRLGVYLSNTLDEPHHIKRQGDLFGVVNTIAEESNRASEVKQEKPIMVVLGNPPYSGISQNKHYTENDVYKIEPGGKQKLQERKHWLDDDYVKFIRFAEAMVEKNGEGVIGMITAHGYIDNPTFRGMRWHLRQTFDKIYVLDLHGNTTKKETAPDGSEDKNVFDIKTGVSIIFGVKTSDVKRKELATVFKADLYGNREDKFAILDSTKELKSLEWKTLPTETETWLEEVEGKDEYKKGFPLNDLFPLNSNGIFTAIDRLAVFYDKKSLVDTTSKILNAADPYNDFGIKDQRKAKKEERIEELREASSEQPTKLLYRPFDTRYMYYTQKTECWINSPRYKVMQHLLGKDNIAMLFSRQGFAANPNEYDTVFVSNSIVDLNIYRRGGQAVCPLYLYAEDGDKVPNLDKKIVAYIDAIAGDTTPEDVFDYVYAVLHAPSYRIKYQEFLKSDFPRVPYPENKDIFWKLVVNGRHLRELHLLNHPDIRNAITIFPEAGDDTVKKPVYKNGRVYINDTQYWDGVPEVVWNFYIGGYQPAQKYLKDRRNKKLTSEEFSNYEKMIVSLNETIKVMDSIDKVL
ncbi:N-6 DNA methylase [Candidatus Kaiserbacteria bacterium]|nr:N-6 DNA methylase [Candidatus Kaiserbacteria bacterium]